MTPELWTLLSREEVAFGILGRLPYHVSLSHYPRTYWAAPHVAVAMEARDAKEALLLAVELGQALAQGAGFWRGNVIRNERKLLTT